MKKYILIISSLFFLNLSQSCSESDLDLEGKSVVNIDVPNTEERLQLLLNGAYYQMSNTNGYGTELMIFGDLLGDKLFTTNTIYSLTANKNYNSNQNEFGFYALMYNVIMKCNMIINDTDVAMNTNMERMKAEAKLLRGYAYFTLVTYYSPSPTSGVNQEYGVPIVLGNYDSLLQPKRATVAEVYNQIISDLTAGATGATDTPASKSILGKTAAKLLLSRVYLTRRAPGDAELAYQYATDIVNNPGVFAPLSNPTGLQDVTKPYNATTNMTNYESYFAGLSDNFSEGNPETIWELDQNDLANQVTGIGSNIALPVFYHRTGGDRKCLLFMQSFYTSFGTTTTGANDDIRRNLLTQTGAPTTDTPRGYWTNKYPVKTNQDKPNETGSANYMRNIKVLRFAEAQLNQIEALYLTGQNALALTKLNIFSASRKGRVTYTGTNLLNDILSERSKEFYGEGQRFWDLKRYNLDIIRPTNCIMNCNTPATDKLLVLPMTLGSLNANANLTQYPGYN